MNFSMTLDRSTVSCSNTENMYIVLQHVEACFLAAGYTTETFVEYLAAHLENEHGMLVMPEKDYHDALDTARAEGRPSATEDSDYMAGLVDYGLYDEPQGDGNEDYMAGWHFAAGVEHARIAAADCDDSDDGTALASAGWGTDEDYGDCGDRL